MRNGDWIQTYSGNQMYPLDPRTDEIHIGDIAHSLSNLCRFNGHVKEFYSVAEHCCHVCDILPREMKLAGLLHDASEAYLCDLPRPIKRSAGFAPLYVEAENALMQTIARRYEFCWPMEAAIIHADDALLHTEALQLMAPLHPKWGEMAQAVPGLVLPCWGPDRSRSEFCDRFREYGRP